MLRSFRKPYAKLFSGDVFTTVRVVSPYARGRLSKIFGEDVVYLYPRSIRMTKLGRARVIGSLVMPIEIFRRDCTEDFARYDAETSKDELVRFVEKTIDGYFKRGVSAYGVQVFTYLWTYRTLAHSIFAADHYFAEKVDDFWFEKMRAYQKNVDADRLSLAQIDREATNLWRYRATAED